MVHSTIQIFFHPTIIMWMYQCTTFHRYFNVACMLDGFCALILTLLTPSYLPYILKYVIANCLILVFWGVLGEQVSDLFDRGSLL